MLELAIVYIIIASKFSKRESKLIS
jgi:hypothetical protein